LTARVLEGIRVLDLTRVWAGPLAARMLAHMGAEVIRIEAPIDPYSGTDSTEGGEDPRDVEPLYNDFNRNKLGITLDLSVPEGKDVFKRFVKISDVVVENYTPRVMANFGLEYSVLREVNPSLIMISMPGYGNTGPYRDYPAYGTTLEQHAGFSSLIGYPDSGPYRTQSTYTDPLASINAAGAVMLALYHRRRTGRGQYIELAQIEVSVCCLGEPLLDFAMNQRAPERRGNRHPSMAPHGAYRCLGDDAWLSITIANDEEWQTFVEAIGHPSWTDDPRFADQLDRWRHQDELDKLVAEWALNQEHRQAMHLLQRAGVTAAAVLNAREVMEDPHLVARAYFYEVTHPKTETHLYPGLPLRLSDIPGELPMPAPCIGQHSRYVLTEILGMSDEEADPLFEAGVLGEGHINGYGEDHSALSINSTLRRILSDERAKAILEKYQPGATSHPQMGQAMGMSLRQIASYSQGRITDEILKAMDEELSKL